MQLSLFEEEKQKPTQKEDLRKCKKCKQELPLDQFYIKVKKYGHGNLTHYYSTRCAPCEISTKKTIETLKKSHTKPRHNVCACCGTEASSLDAQGGKTSFKPNRFLVLDHCHETEQFRGWICQRCNVGLGGLGDNVEGLEKGLKYLRKFEDTIK